MEDRYSRQILFKPIGESGQEQLAEKHVVIIGCGALGSALAETLVRAGVGRLTIVDRDYVEPSNLQRQQLFTEDDALQGVPKVVAAKNRLTSIRSDVHIAAILDHLNGTLLEDIAQDADILLDGTDNFETRLLMNDVAWKFNIPWIYGACVGSTSTIFPFIPGKTPCFRCLLPILPSVNETCDTAGIIAPAVQITTAYQSAEALKWLTGNQTFMRDKVLHLDAWHNTQFEAGISKIRNEDCETCSSTSTYPALTNEASGYAVLCGRDTVQISPEGNRSLTLDDVENVVRRIGISYRKTPYFVEFTANTYRCILFGNGRLFIHGTKNISEGRKLYHQLFG